MSDELSSWIASWLLLGLRIAPVFAFAPPFSLIHLPVHFRVLLGLGISICLVCALPQETAVANVGLYSLVMAGVRELMLGIVFVLTLQLAFAALYVAGRTVDIQAGFGLALLIDPTSKSQMPLVGTLFAYMAGMSFFAADGHLALLRLFAVSVKAVPLGTWAVPFSLDRLFAFISITFASALGVAGGIILVLFLIDILIALLSRTVPQMNVLVLGFQVKTLALLTVLAVSFGISGALITRMMNMTLQALPGLF